MDSFHNRIRYELLEDNSIENLNHARLLVTQWSRRYNDFPSAFLTGLPQPKKVCGTVETRKHDQHLNEVNLILKPRQCQ